MSEIFGDLKIYTLVNCANKYSNNEKMRRVTIASVECYYEDAQMTYEYFVENNKHIKSNNLMAEFVFRRMI